MSTLDQREDEISLFLAELGLNEYETRAYLTILEGGIVVAREVSDRAGIPYAKVYQTLNSLINKLLILGDESRPKKFRARNPEEAIPDRLDALEMDWQASHNRRKKLVKSILPELTTLFQETDIQPEKEQGVWNITGLSNILSRVNKLVGLTQERILITAGDIDFFDNNLEKILTQRRSDVMVEILGNMQIDSDNNTRVHHHTQLGLATRIVFDQFAMITIVETKKGKYGAGEYTAVQTQINEIVDSYIELFSSIVQG